MAILIKIRDSEILSNTESRYAPFLLLRLVAWATHPSTISKNPEIRSITLPAKEDTYQLSPKEDADDIYIRPLAAAKIRLRAVQKFGLNPLDAKREPILSSPLNAGHLKGCGLLTPLSIYRILKSQYLVLNILSVFNS